MNQKWVSQLIPIEEVEQKLLQKSGLKKDDEVRLVLWTSYGEDSASSFMSDDKIAVILAEGEIHMGSGAGNETIYSDELSSLMPLFLNDELYVNVPLNESYAAAYPSTAPPVRQVLDASLPPR